MWYRMEYRAKDSKTGTWYPHGSTYVLQSDGDVALSNLRKYNPHVEYRLQPFEA